MQTVSTKKELERQLKRRLGLGQHTFEIEGENPNGEAIVVVDDVLLRVSPSTKRTAKYILGMAEDEDDTYLQITTRGVSPPLRDLFLSDAIILHGTIIASNIVATFLVSYEGEEVKFAEGTNTEGYYYIYGLTVRISEAGIAALDERVILPNISLVTASGVTGTNVIETILLEIPKRQYLIPEYGKFQVVFPRSVPVRTGGYISFKIRAPTEFIPFKDTMMQGTTLSNRMALVLSDTGYWYVSRGEMYVDDVRTDQYPIDGEVHLIRIQGTSYGQMGRLFGDPDGKNGSRIPIWDLFVSKSDIGSVFYPMDDGWTETGVIRETLQGYDATCAGAEPSDWIEDVFYE
jgi:hypothetical protein